MTIHVTGSSSHVVDSLRRCGADVNAINPKDGDLCEPDIAEFRLQEADTIVHPVADIGGVVYLKSIAGRADDRIARRVAEDTPTREAHVAATA